MSTNNPMSNIPPLGPPTGMMPGSGPSKFKPIDPIRVLRGNWLWIVIAAVIGGAMGFGGWYVLNDKFPQYTSESQFKVDGENIDLATGRTTPIRMAELEPRINSEVQSILGEPILLTILNQPSVQGTDWFEQFDGDIQEALEELVKEVLRAAPIRETQLFEVRATTPNENDARVILGALTTEYNRLKDFEVSIESDRALTAARDRFYATEEAITGIQGEISRFLTNNKIETLQEITSVAAQEVQRIGESRYNAYETYNSLQASYEQLLERQEKEQFDPSDEERQIIESGPEIMNIDAELRQLRVALEVQLERFKPEHPVIKNLEAQILATKRERADEFDEQARILFFAKVEQSAIGQQFLERTLAKLDADMLEWTKKREDNFALIQEYETLQRELIAAEEEKAKADAQIQNLLELERTRARVVVEQTITPTQAKQTFPWEPEIMIPGVLILITSIVTGLIFLRELLDQRVRSAADVKMIPDAALIGMIPSADEDRRSRRTIDRVVEQQPAGLLAESFRQVRTAVLSKMDRRGYKTVMVVSAKPRAGVTSIAQNLGASCALSGRRVLIIDANFRRPNVANLMGINGRPGLADLLTGQEDIDTAVDMVQTTSTQNLSVLPAGNSENAAVELFENPRFRELMARLESDYDLLIIDAPPALLTSDAQLLSRHVDAMLLVSRARSDTRGMLQRLYRELDGQRADILGIVLNGVQASAGGYLKRNFREFQSYSGPDRRTKTRPKQAPAPAPQPVLTNGEAAEMNGSASRSESEDAPMPIEADDLPGDDEDVFGGFDLTEDDKEK